MSSVATHSTSRTWSFPKRTIMELASFTAVIWLGFVIVILVAAYSIERWGTLSDSIWEEARQAAQWFFLFLGVYVGSELLPRYIAYGKTRRDFAIESGFFVVVISLFGAVLVTLGFVAERLLYRVGIIGIEPVATRSGLYDSSRDYGMIMLEAMIVLTVWTIAGIFISAAWYRNADYVLFAIIAALGAGALLELGLGTNLGPISGIVRKLFDPAQPPVLITIGATVAAIASLAWLAWAVIRDIPIRNVSA